MRLKVAITCDPRYYLKKKQISETVAKALKKGKVGSGKIEISVAVVGERKMLELARQFRKIDQAGEILTFALEDPGETVSGTEKGFVKSPDGVLRLGDIVISYSAVVAAASANNILVEDEVKLLIEHGVRHLLGIHHQ